MEWARLGVDGIRSLAWPVAVVVIILLFRRQIRELLPNVREAEFGGLKLRLETLQQEVRRAPENTRRRLSSEDLTAKRLAIENQLLALSQEKLGADQRRTERPEAWASLLSDKGVLSESTAASINDYILITDQLLRSPSMNDDEAVRALCVGDMLFASLRHTYLVEHLVDDLGHHLIWQPPPGERNKYHFWAAIAAESPRFDYRYEVLLEAVNRIDERDHRAAVPLPTPEEFVDILQFRRRELLRIMDLLWGKEVDSVMKGELEWRWPEEWGHISWTGPIVRPETRHELAEQLFLTTRAIELYCRRLTTLG